MGNLTRDPQWSYLPSGTAIVEFSLAISRKYYGQDIERIAKDFDRDFWMTAVEAKEYGLVDEVLLLNPRKQKAQNL